MKLHGWRWWLAVFLGVLLALLMQLAHRPLHCNPLKPVTCED